MTRRTGPWLLASSLLLAVIVAPFAVAAGEGKPVKLGKRNPARGSAVRTTHVIAKTKRIGIPAVKIVNNGKGAAGDLSCRSAIGSDPVSTAKSMPCLRVANLAGGKAFQFQAVTGATIGVLQAGTTFTDNPNVKPFVTNATGEATGLNADKVDGKNAADIIAEARSQNPAGSAPSFAFARVGADGKTDQARSQGVTDANIVKSAPGVYCFYSLTSRPKNANVTLDGVPGETAVDTTTKGGPCPTPSQHEMTVFTYDSAGAPADKGFYLSLTGTTG